MCEYIGSISKKDFLNNSELILFLAKEKVKYKATVQKY